MMLVDQWFFLSFIIGLILILGINWFIQRNKRIEDNINDNQIDINERRSSRGLSADVHGSAKALSVPIKRCGMLMKKRQFFRYWAERYFVLEEGRLYYYLKETDHYPKGFINVKACSIEPKYLKKNDFKISEIEINEKSTGVCWELKDDDPVNLEKWLQALTD